MGPVVDRDFLARIDEHMERGNVLMDGVMKEVRLTREFMADNRAFTQQMIARVDRMTRDNAHVMDRMAERLDRMTDELERQGAERREESRAERQALLAVIDRMGLDPPSGAP